MAVRGAGTIAKPRVAAMPKPPKAIASVVKGPGVPKMASAGVQKIPTLESLSVRARRGEAPKLVLAKAAAGASSTRSKRNPNYPTP